jgi:hypothetical protein
MWHLKSRISARVIFWGRGKASYRVSRVNGDEAEGVASCEAAPAFDYRYFSTSTTYLRITLLALSRWGARSVQAFDL